jgi:hypothetical protein
MQAINKNNENSSRRGEANYGPNVLYGFENYLCLSCFPS